MELAALQHQPIQMVTSHFNYPPLFRLIFVHLPVNSQYVLFQMLVPPEELYATQLAQLQEMGFFDTRENLQALAATRGNVHAAVERLLGNLGP